MRNLQIFCLSLALSACAGGKECELRERLNNLPMQDALERFRALPPQNKVDVYVCDLKRNKPVASPYEFILKEQGGSVASLLLEEANKADGYLVQTAVLASIGGLRAEDRRQLPVKKLESAIGRCKELAGNSDDYLCVSYERELLAE